MFRRCVRALVKDTYDIRQNQRQPKKPTQWARHSELAPTRHFKKRERAQFQTQTGELIKGGGESTKDYATTVKGAIQDMEKPVLWVWYPWRRHPEPPTGLPTENKLKNLHGAVVTELTPRERKQQTARMWGQTLPESRQKTFEGKHPFVASILKELEGKPKGFPFWYKKYPTRESAYENRFNIPTEMLDGYSPEVKSAVAGEKMNEKELVQAQIALYTERYATHPLDTQSPAVMCIKKAIICRELRQTILSEGSADRKEYKLRTMERSLLNDLRHLRKIDFRKYWEVIRDHDVQDLIQPMSEMQYRYGDYWRYDWDSGLALKNDIPDFMDPRGMVGCIETGRSRSEVARDLGLSYTRPLVEKEKKKLSSEARYYERLMLFKSQHPEQAREQQRSEYVKKFSGLFVKINSKTASPDFPWYYRYHLGRKNLRWTSKRHGPKVDLPHITF